MFSIHFYILKILCNKLIINIIKCIISHINNQIVIHTFGSKEILYKFTNFIIEKLPLLLLWKQEELILFLGIEKYFG